MIGAGSPGDGRSRLSRDAERVRQIMIEALCDPPLGTQAAESKQEFSPTQARILVKDLFEHSAWIYWTDFLLTLFVAYGAVALYLSSPIFSLRCCIGFTVASFSLFRWCLFFYGISQIP